MRRPLVLLPLLLLAAAPPGAARLIGVYQGWGAFRGAGVCYAIARPVDRGRARGDASVAIGTWPRRGLRTSLAVHLGRERDRAAGVTLSIGDRRFALVADGRDAFAPDAPTDRAAVAAIRQGRSMSVDAVAVGGAPFTEVYRLGGAATAIDAAALACIPRPAG